MKGIAPVMRDTIHKAVQPLVQRLLAAEAKEPLKGDKGEDGFGFDDLNVLHDGERGFTFRFERDGKAKDFTFELPVMLDRGVWKEGSYRKGDAVSWGGSLWIAQKDTEAKPDSPDSGFRLAVKRGRDGKDAK